MCTRPYRAGSRDPAIPGRQCHSFAVPEVNYVLSSTPFAGAYGVPFQPDGGGHPNAAGVNSGPYEDIRAFDNVPIQGGSYDPPFSLVSGQLYYYRPGTVTDPDDFYTSGTTAYINRKLMATGAACGSHPLIDISGPGSSMATALQILTRIAWRGPAESAIPAVWLETCT
jgi:hypothetical protein